MRKAFPVVSTVARTTEVILRLTVVSGAADINCWAGMVEYQ